MPGKRNDSGYGDRTNEADRRQQLLAKMLQGMSELERRRDRLMQDAHMLDAHSRTSLDAKDIDELGKKLDDCNARLDHLRRSALRQIDLSRAPKHLSVFLSYSPRSASTFVDILSNHIESRFKEVELDNTRGFDRPFDRTIVETVWTSIARCDAVICVWTGEYPIDLDKRKYRDDETESARTRRHLPRGPDPHQILYPESENGNWLPSPWMPLELGMAMSLGKPHFIVVDQRVSPSYLLKVSAETPHIFVPWVDSDAKCADPNDANCELHRKWEVTHYEKIAPDVMNGALFRAFLRHSSGSDYLTTGLFSGA